MLLTCKCAAGKDNVGPVLVTGIGHMQRWMAASKSMPCFSQRVGAWLCGRGLQYAVALSAGICRKSCRKLLKSCRKLLKSYIGLCILRQIFLRENVARSAVQGRPYIFRLLDDAALYGVSAGLVKSAIRGLVIGLCKVDGNVGVVVTEVDDVMNETIHRIAITKVGKRIALDS